MKSIADLRTTNIRGLFALIALLCFVVGGCRNDTLPTGPYVYTSPITPGSPASVDGIWIGSGTYTEPPTYDTLSVIGNFTQTVNSFSGTLVWIIPTDENPYTGYKTTVTVNGWVWQSRISIQEKSAGSSNGYWSSSYITGTVSATRDEIVCTRWESSTSRKVIGALRLVKWK